MKKATEALPSRRDFLKDNVGYTGGLFYTVPCLRSAIGACLHCRDRS